MHLRYLDQHSFVENILMLFSCTVVIIYLCDSWNKAYLIVNTGENFTQLDRRVHKFVTNLSLINSWALAEPVT